MFTPDAFSAMVADRGERLHREADLARFTGHQARFARSARRRNRHVELVRRVLGGLRAGARRAGLRPTSTWASWS